MAKTLNNVALAVLASTLAGCGATPAELNTARENGVIVAYHGLMSNDGVTGAGEIAKDLGMVYVDGTNPKAIQLVRAAQNSKYGPHDIYHSMGSTHVEGLLKKCEKEKLQFRTSHSLDAWSKVNLPSNAGELYNYISEAPYKPGKQYSMGGIQTQSETVPGTDHFNVCRKSRAKIEERIRQGLRATSTNK